MPKSTKEEKIQAAADAAKSFLKAFEDVEDEPEEKTAQGHAHTDDSEPEEAEKEAHSHKWTEKGNTVFCETCGSRASKVDSISDLIDGFNQIHHDNHPFLGCKDCRRDFDTALEKSGLQVKDTLNWSDKTGEIIIKPKKERREI